MLVSVTTVSAPSGRMEDLGITDGLVQLSFLVQAVLERTADGYDLPVLQARLLGVLRDREPGMAQLGALLGLDKSSTTGLVNRVEHRGLVRRTPVPEDKRAIRVRLTEQGRALAEAFVAEVAAQLDQAVGGLAELDRKRLSLLASQVVQHKPQHEETDMDHVQDPASQSAPSVQPSQNTQSEDRIAVVVGSTRPTRICLGVADWIRGVIQQGSPLRYELLDLAEVGLPLLDEPLKASLQQYEHEHTRQWSRTVSSYSGFLFVSPQYNWGYPAALKNSLDYLYHEWHDKPAAVATYGTRGGNRAAAQLLTVLQGLHMRALDSHLELVITNADVDEDWQLKDVAATLNPYRDQIRAIDEQMIEALKDDQ